MNKLVVGAIAAMLPFTAPLAGGVNVNLHNVAAAKVVSLPAMPSMRAAVPAMSTATSLRGLAPMAAGSLPGLAPVAAQGGSPGPLKQSWFLYDKTVYPGEVTAYKLTVKNIFLNGIGGMVGYTKRISCPDCGSPVQDVQGVINTGFAMLGSGLTVPVPHPKFPDGLAPFANLLLDAVFGVTNTVGNILITLGGGGGDA